jgi:hypothetical protein
MLYDLFICHASEDKESFVRPLALALKKENIEVWYDEFSLKLGDSIRRSINLGLSQSRFGLVVISPSFLAKEWTQFELDGLTEREISGREKIILPVWHDIDHEQILSYSPPLAGKKAALSKNGIPHIINEIMQVIHPQGSPLIAARDILLEWDVKPPVVTDKYWIDVIEASSRASSFSPRIPENSIWGRWSFPLPEKTEDAQDWGQRLAWTAMQLAWTDMAQSIPISPLTPPDDVLDFIYESPGLYEVGMEFPTLLAEYAPQLTIPGFEGDFEKEFEAEYLQTVERGKKKRAEKSREGSALTTDKQSPECEERWALRHQHFGYYQSQYVADAYFGGGMFGPRVSPYLDSEHLIWLFSSASDWLPSHIKPLLLDGMAKLHKWQWGEYKYDHKGSWENYGEFSDALYEFINNGTAFNWTSNLKNDVRSCIQSAIDELKLPETAEVLLDRFIQFDIPSKQKLVEQSRKNRKKK